MSAPDAAVQAVMEALGCEREAWPTDTSPGWCSEHWVEDGTPQGASVPWTDRGCPVAVKAADAAVAPILDAIDDAAREAYTASTRRVILGKEWEDLHDSEAAGWVVRALRKAMRGEP